jgi:hypothetical protein
LIPDGSEARELAITPALLMTISSEKSTDQTSSKEHCLSVDDPKLIARIRDLLDREKYMEQAIESLTASADGQQAASESGKDLAGADQPLLRLFLYTQPVERKAVSRVLKRSAMKQWIAAGLIEQKADMILPLVRLRPFWGLIVAEEIDWTSDAAARINAVMGVTGGTQSLSKMTVRHRSRLTLDLGTGTGIQAMLAADHSDEVIATDLNLRALNFARFNAQLNGISNIEFVEGDLFEPVKGKTFDLIICNPPFSVSPDFRCLYRDNPMDDDEFLQRIVHEVPNYLSKDGYAHIIGHWVQSEDQNWRNRISAWFKQTGCDVWILRWKTTDVSTYATNWLQGYDESDSDQLRAKWMDYYKARGIGSIGSGIISMRRTDNPRHWARIEEAPPILMQGCGEYVDRGFWLQNFLNARPNPSSLLNEALFVAPHARLEQLMKPAKGGRRMIGARLTLTRGLGYSVEVAPGIADILLHCDAKLPLGQVLTDVAARNGLKLVDIVSQCLPVLRQLIARGFIHPAPRAIRPRFPRPRVRKGVRAGVRKAVAEMAGN